MCLNKLIGIVLVNYNGAAFQNDCIKSLLNLNYTNYYIIIVDNNSSDTSMEELNVFDDKRIIKIFNEENLGVAQGNNIGIKKSIELCCDYTLLLNNDTEVDMQFLRLLIESDEDVAVPKIYYYKTNKLWYGGGHFQLKKATAVHENYKCSDVDINFKKYYTYSPTCCMLIKNKIFSSIGMMDEKYFLYLDDTDFCYRLYLNGIRIRFCENAIVYHKVSMSTGGDESPIFQYYNNRNRFYFAKKYSLGFSVKLFLYLSRYIKILKSLIKNTKERKYIRLAIHDFKHNYMGRCDKLKEI